VKIPEELSNLLHAYFISLEVDFLNKSEFYYRTATRKVRWDFYKIELLKNKLKTEFYHESFI